MLDPQCARDEQRVVDRYFKLRGWKRMGREEGEVVVQVPANWRNLKRQFRHMGSWEKLELLSDWLPSDQLLSQGGGRCPTQKVDGKHEESTMFRHLADPCKMVKDGNLDFPLTICLRDGASLDKASPGPRKQLFQASCQAA